MEDYIHVVLKDRILHKLEDDPEGSGWSLLKWTDVPPLDPMLGAVLGDCAHNTQSALDQLMWVLVGLNGGTLGGLRRV